MKSIKFILIVILLGSVTAFSQSAEEKFNQASKLFENGKNKEAITLVQSIEKEVGANPKIYSLYVNAYLADGDYVNAKIALNKFKLLVGDKTSESIKVILDKEREIDEGLAKADKEFAQQQLAEANSIVSSSERENEEKLQTAVKKDLLVELEMWQKAQESNNAADYYLFIQRYPNGQFLSQATAKMNEIGDPEWNEVKKSNDAFKYRDYINKYPNSPFIEQAQRRYDVLAEEIIAWEKIKDSSNYRDFETYLRKYPSGVYSQTATQKEEQLFWENIKEGNSYRDFETYLRKYPSGVYSQAAIQKEQLFFWESIKESNSYRDFEIYLRKYPYGTNTTEARQRLTFIAWESIRNSRDYKDFEEYIRKYPNSPNIADAKKAMEPLMAGRMMINSIGIEFIFIPAGEFMMGSPENEKDRKKNEGPQRKVTIAKGFWLSKFVVTKKYWNISDGRAECDDCAVYITWNEAKSFVENLNKQNDGFIYSLPTEAEWEYAARAGAATAYVSGNDKKQLDLFITEELKGFGAFKKFKGGQVGLKKPNPFGLFDISGRPEWVEDIYSDNYENLPTDGSANLKIGKPNLTVQRGYIFDINRIKKSFSGKIESQRLAARLDQNKDKDVSAFRIVIRQK